MAQEIEKTGGAGVPSVQPSRDVINLGAHNAIDLTGLSDEQVTELKRQHGVAMIELTKKAGELKLDNQSIAMTLDTLNTEASKATQSNVSMTATHTQSTSIGRTEVVIGNTDRAASGKLSASAIGVPDRTLWIVGIIAVGAIIVALIFRH